MRHNTSWSPLLLALGAILIAVEVVATAAIVLSLSGDLPSPDKGTSAVVFWSSPPPPLAPTVAPNVLGESNTGSDPVATPSPTPVPTPELTPAPDATREPAAQAPVPVPAAVYVAPTPIPGAYRADLSDQLYGLLNGARTSNGLVAVPRNDSLIGSAQFYTQYLFVSGNPYTLDHWLVGGPGDRAWSRGYCCAVGEILVESEGSAQGMLDLWMQSAPHRSVILDPQYKAYGVACYGGPYVGDDGNVHHPIVCAAEFGSG